MQKPRGTKDVFGDKASLRAFIFETLNKISRVFNFQPIEVPVFEFEDVFVHSIGQTSDVVSKEMYHFQDRAHRKLVLRPEGTAGIIRAVVENKLYANALPLKLFYFGPMFRYENPQHGRQRQFTQYGVEVLAPKSPHLDAEVILLAITILDSFKIGYNLKINSLGDQKTRDQWLNALRTYFQPYKNELEPLSRTRLAKNPARILDDKIEMEKPFVQRAPQISQFYTRATTKHLKEVTSFLEEMGVSFSVDHSLVRGFDYYNEIVFEFVPNQESPAAQSTIIGGGRYDNLVANFGGPELSGVGFAIGIERLATELAKGPIKIAPHAPRVYVVNIHKEATPVALSITYLLRRAGVHAAWNYRSKRLHKALERADKTSAPFKIIVGDREISSGVMVLKWKREQKRVAISELVGVVKKLMATGQEKSDENN